MGKSRKKETNSSEKPRKKRILLMNEAEAEKRAIRDCQMKIQRLIAKSTDIRCYEKIIDIHKARYREIMAELNYLN